MASSRPYRVTAKEPISDVVVAEDHVQVKLDIPPVASREETSEILSDVLKGRKFEDGGDGKLTRERNGVKVEVDPDDGTVTVSAEAEGRLPPNDPSPCGCRAAAKLKTAENTREDLQKQVTNRLEGEVTRLGCELEGVANQVTKEALKRKAGRLGNIKQLIEDKAGGMTIVVEV